MPEFKQMDCLIVLDFDHTILSVNSDFEAIGMLEDHKNLPERNNFPLYMTAVNQRLAAQGITPQAYKEFISSLPLTVGMHNVLKWAKVDRKFDLYIASDANQLFIQWILDYNGIDFIDKIFTNTGAFNHRGELEVWPYCATPHDCPNCNINMCKGEIMSQLIWGEHLATRQRRYSKVIFVGDGHNDFCAGVRLGPNDLLAVRRDFHLHKMITGDVNLRSKLNCKWITWENGVDLKHALLQYVD